MDLSGFADIHPKPRNAREIRPSSIGGEPEKPLVKIEIGGKAGCVPVNPYPLVVYLDDVYRHVLTSLFRNASSASAPYKGEREQTRRALSPSRTF